MKQQIEINKIPDIEGAKAKDNYARLKEMLQWEYKQKLYHTIEAIQTFASRTGNVAISFSGGKDSTVLLDICRRFCDKDMKAFFINTSNEYPEIVRFVKTFDNVDFVRPKLNFKQVVEKYGFPLISKEQAQYIHQYRTTKSKKMKELRWDGRKTGSGRVSGKISERWKFLTNAPFMVSDHCCRILKKYPAKEYATKNNISQFVGTRTEESALRLSAWMRTGCNNYDERKSTPLSIWTETDINKYISDAKLRICELYNQGFERTGCMFCGFGCKGLNDFRFVYLRENKPKLYEYMMNITNNGITFRRAIQITYGNEIEWV